MSHQFNSSGSSFFQDIQSPSVGALTGSGSFSVSVSPMAINQSRQQTPQQPFLTQQQQQQQQQSQQRVQSSPQQLAPTFGSGMGGVGTSSLSSFPRSNTGNPSTSPILLNMVNNSSFPSSSPVASNQQQRSPAAGTNGGMFPGNNSASGSGSGSGSIPTVVSKATATNGGSTSSNGSQHHHHGSRNSSGTLAGGGGGGGASGSSGNLPGQRTQRVGDYELGRDLGSGATSHVRLCRNIVTGETFAAKIIPRGNPEDEENLKREVRALSNIDNEHVIKYRQLLLSSHNFYVIMEAALGGDLVSLLTDQATTPTIGEVRRMFSQLVRGLTACHMAKVAHRDLKPDNILITRDNNIKISDFGVCRFHQGRHKAQPAEYSHTFVGTIEYAAPEVIAGGGYDGFRADMWSLGCVLHAMLTCKFPFGFQPTKQDQIDAIRSGRYVPLPPGTDPAAVDLVSKLIVLDPSKRLTCTEVLMHEFVKSAGGSFSGASKRRPSALQMGVAATGSNVRRSSGSSSGTSTLPVVSTCAVGTSPLVTFVHHPSGVSINSGGQGSGSTASLAAAHTTGTNSNNSSGLANHSTSSMLGTSLPNSFGADGGAASQRSGLNLTQFRGVSVGGSIRTQSDEFE